MSSKKFRVKTSPQAEEDLKKLSQEDKAMYKKFYHSLDLIQKKGLQLKRIKKLKQTKNGFRLRLGRYRALFSLQESTIKVLKIFMEKDPSKDYKKWIDYLTRRGKLK